MPSVATKIKASTIKPYEVTIGSGQYNWKPGVITIVDESRLPVGAVTQAKNMMQTQDGVWSSRWGTKNYGATFTGPVTGQTEYVIYNDDGTSTQWMLVMDNGLLKKSKDGGSWTSVAPDTTFSTTNKTQFLQYDDKIMICNGVDNLSYFDIPGDALVIYTGLTTPASPTPSRGSGLSSGSFTLYYQVTAISAVGETPGSTAASITVNVDRNSWYNPSATVSPTTGVFVSLTWTQVTNAIGYNIYISDGISGVAYYLDSVAQPASGDVVYTDYGSAAINDFIEVPVTDTTVAPVFEWMTLSDNRLWGIGDPNNPNRVYWAATGTYAQAFNAYLGGGWVDILPGGAERPRVVTQFRNGQGNPLTTVLMADPSGYGSTWHIQLQSSAIGNTTIAIPVVIHSMGTFGSLSPFGVIITNQNVYFHSGTGGFYSTGSVPTLFNVLATNEVSIPIRPDVKAINLSSLSDIVGIEFDRKLWWSVPYGEAGNNRIFIYDLEKQNWNPYAFDLGVTGFVRYTDNDGLLHLLGVPVTGDQFIEFNSAFLDDNGTPFETHLQTGLIFVSPDHIQWAQVTYVYYEFSRPNGSLTMIFSGTQKNQPLLQLEAITGTVGSSLSSAGFSSYGFSSEPYSFSDTAPTTVTSLSVKERVRINKLLNNWEGEVSTQGLRTNYTLNQITVVGQYIPTADPSSWITN